MKTCIRCVNPTTRPNLYLDDEGVCPVCRHHERKRNGLIDWDERHNELVSIGQWGKENSKSRYDCIIGVSGGKDSTRQAFYVRDTLNLNPLLVSCVYPPEQLTERGARNLSNLVSHGFDTLYISLNPQVWKKMMRQAFFLFGNLFKASELALYAIPIHTAIGYKIPLVFLGENPAYTIGESHGGSTTGDANRMKYCNTLGGGDPAPVMAEDTTHQDVHFYTYPSDDDMDYANIKLAYLGYFIEDFNSFRNAEFSMKRGLEIRNEPCEDIGDITATQSLDEDFYIVNQMMKYLKLGYGQVTDKIGEAISMQLMDRETGFELVRRYDGKCAPKYILKFCEYLGITKEQFWAVVDDYRNQDLFTQSSDGEWVLKDQYQPSASMDGTDDCDS